MAPTLDFEYILRVYHDARSVPASFRKTLGRLLVLSSAARRSVLVGGGAECPWVYFIRHKRAPSYAPN